MTSDSSEPQTPALIMGNGPSLRSIDFREASKFATFGMNAAYRYWERVGWWPTFYSCLDLVVGESHQSAIRGLIEHTERNRIRAFLLRHHLIKRLGAAGRSKRVICYERLLADGVLPKLRDVTTGSHTLLWAESLGYRTILLAGVDCRYVEVVPGAALEGDHLIIERHGTNPNYFFDGYQRVGDKFNVPNMMPDMHVNSWANASNYLLPGTLVVNLNAESAVEAFPKNLDTPNPLAPGTVNWPLSSNRHPDKNEFASSSLQELAGTVSRLNRYRPNEQCPDIATMLNELLNPVHSDLETEWRKSIHTSPISIVRQGESRHSRQYASPIAEVAIHGIGNLTLTHSRDTTWSPRPLTTTTMIQIYHVSALSLANKLLITLHESCGTPPVRDRIRRKIQTTLASIAAFLPHRLRAIDYRNWRSYPRRLLGPLLRRSSRLANR